MRLGQLGSQVGAGRHVPPVVHHQVVRHRRLRASTRITPQGSTLYYGCSHLICPHRVDPSKMADKQQAKMQAAMLPLLLASVAISAGYALGVLFWSSVDSFETGFESLNPGPSLHLVLEAVLD